jgi:hypothetical protein
MYRKAALAVGASLGMAFLTACSDTPTAPVVTPIVLKPNLATGDVTTSIPVAVPGKLIVCKAGNANGTFNFTRRTEGATIVASSMVGNQGSPNFTGANPVPPGSLQTSSRSIATGNCLEVANDDSPSGNGSHVTVTEQAAANTTFTIDCRFRGYNLEGTVIQPEVSCNPYTNGGDIFLNHFHGYVLVYTNTFTPPPETCDFSTFGGITNNITYGGNAGRIEDPPGFAYGDLNFKNHTNGDHIHVWNVTDYGHPDTGPLSEFEDSRLAFGLASVNGGPETVPVEFRFYDAGEPAKKEGDMVYLKVGGVVLISAQEVGNGNIQLHDKHCKKAPKAEKH